VGLDEGALSGLDEGDAVLGVRDGAVEAADLCAHFFGDGESCGVVCGAVDAQARGKLLYGPLERVVSGGEDVESLKGRNIMINYESHNIEPPCNLGIGIHTVPEFYVHWAIRARRNRSFCLFAPLPSSRFSF